MVGLPRFARDKTGKEPGRLCCSSYPAFCATKGASSERTVPSAEPPALLFDLDGTLIDSVYQHVLAWYEALTGFGIELSV